MSMCTTAVGISCFLARMHCALASARAHREQWGLGTGPCVAAEGPDDENHTMGRNMS